MRLNADQKYQTRDNRAKTATTNRSLVQTSPKTIRLLPSSVVSEVLFPFFDICNQNRSYHLIDRSSVLRQTQWQIEP